MLELTDGIKALFKETAERLKGSERRQFMAKTVEELGTGGQRLAERELGWNRDSLSTRRTNSSISLRTLTGTCSQSSGLIAAISSGTVFSIDPTLSTFYSLCYPPSELLR